MALTFPEVLQTAEGQDRTVLAAGDISSITDKIETGDIAIPVPPECDSPLKAVAWLLEQCYRAQTEDNTENSGNLSVFSKSLSGTGTITYTVRLSFNSGTDDFVNTITDPFN